MLPLLAAAAPIVGRAVAGAAVKKVAGSAMHHGEDEKQPQQGQQQPTPAAAKPTFLADSSANLSSLLQASQFSSQIPSY